MLGLTLLGEAVVLLLSLSGELLGIRTNPSKPFRKKNMALSPAAKKWIRRSCISIFVVTVLALILINYVFLQPFVRFAADRVEAKTGIAISYAKMEGNIFSGRFSFSDISLIRNNHEVSTFAIQLRSLEANLAVCHFLLGKRNIESFSIPGGTVNMTMKQRVSENNDSVAIALSTGPEPGMNIETFGRAEKAVQDFYSPRFVFDRISIADLEITIDDTLNERGEYSIGIEEFSSEPLRSYFLWWDILFRSNLKATIDKSDLVIMNSRQGSRKETTWKANDIQDTTLNSLVGGPFSFIRNGKVDFEVSDAWDMETTTEVKMNWKLRLKEAETIVPMETPLLLQPLAKAVVARINNKKGPWEFGFELLLREDQFAGSATLGAQQIWKDGIPIILKQLADALGISEEKITEGAKQVFEGFKQFLKNRETGEANP